MCMESSRLCRYFMNRNKHVKKTYDTYVTYYTYQCFVMFFLLMLLFYLQNRALLDTLRKLRSTQGTGHIAIFNTLAIGHTKHPNEQRISCWPFAGKKLRSSNRQDFVFIRPPGISHGAFELRMDNVWFCKILLLFQPFRSNPRQT